MMNNFVWTIISSIILGVAANLLTPYAARIFGKVFKSVRDKNLRRRENFEKSIKYLLENPTEEVVLRIRQTSYEVTGIIVLGLSAISALLVDTDHNSIVGMASIAFSLIFYLWGMYLLIRAFKFVSLTSELWERKKKQNPEIDLD
jgi:hypothetical protein